VAKGGVVKEKLLASIPEFHLIQDSALREKVLEAWMRAMEKGGWAVEDLAMMPFAMSIKNCPVSLQEHVRVVTQICDYIGKLFSEAYRRPMKINRDYLIAGALLHDIGKLFELTKEKGGLRKSRSGFFLRHPFSGVAHCYQIGIPEEILHLIALHSKEGEGGEKTLEAIILHYADFVSFETVRSEAKTDER
jgi:putative nucleotidyltransferase with HDIG domain